MYVGRLDTLLVTAAYTVERAHPRWNKFKDKDASSSMKAIMLVEKSLLSNPMDILFLDSDDRTVGAVCVKDHGSQSRTVVVDIAGVFAQGLVDTGADITIMGPELFKKITSITGITNDSLRNLIY